MKKLSVLFLVLFLLENITFASNYTARQNYKLNEYNSRGQKTGYTKVYYQGDKSNIKKVERYSTSGKRTNVYR